MGLFAGAGVIFLKATIDKSIKTQDQLEMIVGDKPILGEIPIVKIDEKKLKPLFKNQKKENIFHQTLNFIKTNLIFAISGSNKKVIMISSAIKEEGKSFFTFQLASSFEGDEKKVLVIDTDFRRSKLKSAFKPQKEKSVALEDYLTEKAEIKDVIETTLIKGVDYIRSIHAQFNTPEALRSSRMHELIDRVKKDYDLIFIDTSPIHYVADSLAVAEHVDSVILVVQQGKTDRKVLRDSYKKLLRHQTSVLGVVLTQVKHVNRDFYYY